MKENLQSEIDAHLAILRTLIAPSGLFLAAADVGVATGYDKSWLRDNFYEVMAFEETGDWEISQKTWHALLTIFLKHEDKINWAIEKRPQFSYQYIHARYNPETFEEFWEEWGNKQNDAVGCILFAIGNHELNGTSVIRGEDDKRIVQRLVDYLGTVEYWNDADNGVWEEYEEVHSSSVGACVAGLKKIKESGLAQVPDACIQKGEESLNIRLPRESTTKFTDLALLSLIFPYHVVSEEQTVEILANLEYHLARDMGVVRYRNDRYYNANDDGYSEEAEWTMGFPWLSIIYRERGDFKRADYWLEEARHACDKEGKLPELYYSQTDVPNENNPLGWSESLYIIALKKKLDTLSA
ncbi:TPA: glycoside hydrolase family 15 [Patescibacteria group bacterium]|nr:MAG: Glycoside hydrolase 15-related protein [Parcubacteria group bacterium GW2011_GWD2_42_14]HCC04809.1 glycoside hydrolase family 15 [Patescibacteria group bacterium]